jgi:hypothetical protein
MNYAYYAFDRATGVLFEQLDLGTTYRRDFGRATYVVETHICLWDNGGYLDGWCGDGGRYGFGPNNRPGLVGGDDSGT